MCRQSLCLIPNSRQRTYSKGVKTWSVVPSELAKKADSPSVFEAACKLETRPVSTSSATQRQSPRLKKMKLAQARWYMLVMPTLRRLRQEDYCEFKTCLNYKVEKKEEGKGEERKRRQTC